MDKITILLLYNLFKLKRKYFCIKKFLREIRRKSAFLSYLNQTGFLNCKIMTARFAAPSHIINPKYKK